MWVSLMLLCGLLRSSTAFNITSLPEMAIVEEVDPPTTRPPLVVATQNGLLSGLSLEASKNKTVSAFLGISYARPPLGNLRFRPPQNPEKWSGILGANQQPPSCMQRPDVFFADFEGAREAEPSMPPSEDCLYLNVFVPDILVRIHQGHDDETASILGNGLPVIVWFHGGGFSSGSSLPRGPLQETWTPDPRELASLGQVVVVTVQYRLGSFGFLFLDDQRAPGNVGLLDQKMATIWVRNNIVAFGGDPDKVTLAGQDAGGVLALILLSTSETKLASRIILQSAGIQHPWSYIEPREAFRRTLTLASLLDCPTSGTSREEVIKCLVQKNAEDIVDKEIGVVASPGLNYQPFVPTADGVTIKLEPSKLMPRIAKEMKDIQILIGTNSDEGSKALMYFLPKSFPNRDLSLVEASISQEFFDEAIEKMFSNFPARVVDTIKFQYTNWTNPLDDHLRFEALQSLVADWQYNCPVDQVTQTLADSLNIYKYRFEVNNPHIVWPRWSGVKHGDEFDYIFGRPLATLGDGLFEEKDVHLSNFMIRAWANFAKHGNANGARREHQVGWPRFRPMTTRHVLRIDDVPHHDLDLNDIFTSIVVEDRQENCAFWNRLIPDLMSSLSKECLANETLQVKEATKFLPLSSRMTTTSTTPVTTVSTTTTTTTTTKRPTRPPTTFSPFFEPISKKPFIRDFVQNSLRKKSPLYANGGRFKIIKENLEDQFLPDRSTEVSFRMSVMHPNARYNDAGDSVNNYLIPRSTTATTSTTTFSTTTTTSTTMTSTSPTTTRRKSESRPFWFPGVYDPFNIGGASQQPDFANGDDERVNILDEIGLSGRSRDDDLYFPLYVPPFARSKRQ